VPDPPRTAGAEDPPFDDHGHVEVPDAPGWRYLAIHGEGGDALAVELGGPEGARADFAVPDFVARGDELGDVARIVIRAWERKTRAEGLGA
jgi:hypothetical protein